MITAVANKNLNPWAGLYIFVWGAFQPEISCDSSKILNYSKSYIYKNRIKAPSTQSLIYCEIYYSCFIGEMLLIFRSIHCPGSWMEPWGLSNLGQWKLSCPGKAGLESDDLKHPSNPNHAVFLWSSDIYANQFLYPEIINLSFRCAI